jgi:hypothetical protein
MEKECKSHIVESDQANWCGGTIPIVQVSSQLDRYLLNHTIMNGILALSSDFDREKGVDDGKMGCTVDSVIDSPRKSRLEGDRDQKHDWPSASGHHHDVGAFMSLAVIPQKHDGRFSLRIIPEEARGLRGLSRPLCMSSNSPLRI